MLDINQIYCGDSFELLPKVTDESVDLVICDGPYGVTQNDWDKVLSIQEFNLDLIKMFAPKLKEGGVLYLFGKPDCLDFIDYRPFMNLKSKDCLVSAQSLGSGAVELHKQLRHYRLFCQRKESALL